MNQAINESAPADGAAARPAGGGAYLLRALGAGLVAAVALGLTLLTWALPLMTMLGLFFFMLFGLLIGAVMFRCGAGGRPLAKGAVLAATVLVALTAWGTALYKEAADFPDDFVAGALPKVDIPKGEYERVEAELRAYIGPYLAEKYPPGGVWGYFKMTVAGDDLIVDLPNQPRVVKMRARTRPWVWWTRASLALVLLWGTTCSVAGGLWKRENGPRGRPATAPGGPAAW